MVMLKELQRGLLAATGEQLDGWMDAKKETKQAGRTPDKVIGAVG